MTQAGPPPPPPEPSSTAPQPAAGRGAWSDNPTTYPIRNPSWVANEIHKAAAQRLELEAEMRRTGQADALVVPDLTQISLPGNRACTSTTWIDGRPSVLPRADTVVLLALPRSNDDIAWQLAVRWDVLARVCGRSCWQPVPGLDPPRWITRRWPTPTELDILVGLAIDPN